MKQQFRVVIIGAGNIGAFFDNPDSKDFLTHAHGFSSHKGFKILGFIDSDYEKARKAASIWGGSAFKNLQELEDLEIDVAVLAVPDQLHFKFLKEIVNFHPQLVFAEKPLVSSIHEAEKIIKLYKKEKIALAVNHTRRFVPEFIQLKDKISSGFLGEFISGSGLYGKGALHNGIHLIDLLIYFLGDIRSLNSFSKIYDFTKDDPSVSAVINFGKDRNFVIQGIDSNLYSIFELDFLFEKGRVKIDNSKFMIEEYALQSNHVYKAYKNLVKIKQTKTSQSKALLHCANNIYDYLNSGQALKCTAEDAIKGLRVCLDLKTRK